MTPYTGTGLPAPVGTPLLFRQLAPVRSAPRKQTLDARHWTADRQERAGAGAGCDGAVRPYTSLLTV